MSIADKYYTDAVQVRFFEGINDRGDAVLGEKTVVACRFSYEQKEVLDSKGQACRSTAWMLCGVFIPPLSTVEGVVKEPLTVKSCEAIRRVSGTIDHYEVIL